MDKLNSFQDSCFKKKQTSEAKHKDNESKGNKKKFYVIIVEELLVTE